MSTKKKEEEDDDEKYMEIEPSLYTSWRVDGDLLEQHCAEDLRKRHGNRAVRFGQVIDRTVFPSSLPATQPNSNKNRKNKRKEERKKKKATSEEEGGGEEDGDDGLEEET